MISQEADKPEVAEMWYRKTIDGLIMRPQAGSSVYHLAHLLRTQPGRFAEARQLAEEALAVSRCSTPAPRRFGIRTTSSRRFDRGGARHIRCPPEGGIQAQAREHRRLGRQARMNFAGTRHALRKHLPVIVGAIMAVADREQRQPLEEVLSGREQSGWTKLVAAIRRILEGERDTDTLCADLDYEDSMIIETILAGLADPSRSRICFVRTA